MDENFKEVLNEKPNEALNSDKGKKLTAKISTYTIDEGEHTGTITDAFWYKKDDEKDRVMFEFKLDDGTIFMTSVDGDWIEDYPFSKLISQANISYVEDFAGLRVKFTVRNTEGKNVVFSNIRRIALAE